MKEMLPLKAWGVITNHRFLRLENVKPTKIAAQEQMSYLDRTYPHCLGTRRVVRIEIREVEEEHGTRRSRPGLDV